MPLIHCPDCATEVSDQAAACPKCARPIAAQPQPRVVPVRQETNWLKVLGALMVMGSPVACLPGLIMLDGGNMAGGAIVAVIGFGVVALGFVMFIAGRLQE